MIGGMAKGSGMIEPMMATMLAFVTTDAAVPEALLDRALREAVNDTFNAITVDGECSTNDCVMILANGACGVTIDEVDLRRCSSAPSPCLPRARAGHRSRRRRRDQARHRQRHRRGVAEEARRAAKAIANSPLVKTAVHGGDPNWGRLIAVAGRANVAFELSRAAVTIGSMCCFATVSRTTRRRRCGRLLEEAPRSSSGSIWAPAHASSTVWTCDLSAEIRANQRRLQNLRL